MTDPSGKRFGLGGSGSGSNPIRLAQTKQCGNSCIPSATAAGPSGPGMGQFCTQNADLNNWVTCLESQQTVSYAEDPTTFGVQQDDDSIPWVNLIDRFGFQTVTTAHASQYTGSYWMRDGDSKDKHWAIKLDFIRVTGSTTLDLNPNGTPDDKSAPGPNVVVGGQRSIFAYRLSKTDGMEYVSRSRSRYGASYSGNQLNYLYGDPMLKKLTQLTVNQFLVFQNSVPGNRLFPAEHSRKRFPGYKKRH